MSAEARAEFLKLVRDTIRDSQAIIKHLEGVCSYESPEGLARRLMHELDSHGYPSCGRRMTRDGLRVLAAEMGWDLEGER